MRNLAGSAPYLVLIGVCMLGGGAWLLLRPVPDEEFVPTAEFDLAPESGGVWEVIPGAWILVFAGLALIGLGVWLLRRWRYDERD